MTIDTSMPEDLFVDQQDQTMQGHPYNGPHMCRYVREDLIEAQVKAKTKDALANFKSVCKQKDQVIAEYKSKLAATEGSLALLRLAIDEVR